MLYIETSAKTGQNVEASFFKMASIINGVPTEKRKETIMLQKRASKVSEHGKRPSAEGH